MRLIDADAAVQRLREAYCNDCDRRKGMKNGKMRFCYEIGDAPCRACGTGDAVEWLEEADEVEAIPVEWLKKLQNELGQWDFTASASGDIIRRWEREQGVGIDNSGKSGVWEPLGHISRGIAHPWSEYFKCSLCGYEAYTIFDPPPERCPECGAEMEQEAKE